jgi:hypothetical protein
MVLGMVNQDLLVKIGLSVQMQVLVMGIVNLILRMYTNSGIILNSSSEVWCIKRIDSESYVLYVNENNEPIMTNDINLSMEFSTLDEAQSLIRTFNNPNEYLGTRKPRPNS